MGINTGPPKLSAVELKKKALQASKYFRCDCCGGISWMAPTYAPTWIQLRCANKECFGRLNITHRSLLLGKAQRVATWAERMADPRDRDLEELQAVALEVKLSEAEAPTGSLNERLLSMVRVSIGDYLLSLKSVDASYNPASREYDVQLELTLPVFLAEKILGPEAAVLSQRRPAVKRSPQGPRPKQEEKEEKKEKSPKNLARFAGIDEVEINLDTESEEPKDVGS